MQFKGQVLDEANVNWVSHEVGLPKNEQYNPSYVRLNPRCVVPTLVVNGKVTTDAENIINFVEKNFMNDPSKTSLHPSDPAELKLVHKFVVLGESLFVGALSHGKVPGVEHGGTPAGAKAHKTDIASTLVKHQEKIDMLKDLIEKYADDEYLKLCYEAKLQIVDLTKDCMASEENMQEIVNVTKKAFRDLAVQLSNGPFVKDGWLCSENFTSADLVWGIVMFRLQKLRIGNELLWKDIEIVEAYGKKLFTRESFKTGVIEWLKKLKK